MAITQILLFTSFVIVTLAGPLQGTTLEEISIALTNESQRYPVLSAAFPKAPDVEISEITSIVTHCEVLGTILSYQETAIWHLEEIMGEKSPQSPSQIESILNKIHKEMTTFRELIKKQASFLKELMRDNVLITEKNMLAMLHRLPATSEPSLWNTELARQLMGMILPKLNHQGELLHRLSKILQDKMGTKSLSFFVMELNTSPISSLFDELELTTIIVNITRKSKQRLFQASNNFHQAASKQLREEHELRRQEQLRLKRLSEEEGEICTLL